MLEVIRIADMLLVGSEMWDTATSVSFVTTIGPTLSSFAIIFTRD